MNAQEARRIAESLNDESVKKSIENISIEIKNAANKGKFTTDVYSPIEDVVKKYFEREGYVVKYYDSGRNEFYYRITW